MTLLFRSIFVSVVLLQAVPLKSSELNDGFITAVSDWARYRSRLEAIAQKAKARFPVNSPEYNRAHNSYDQLVQSSVTFNKSLLELIQESKSSDTSAAATTRAVSVGDQFVRDVGPTVNQQADRSLIALVPPFVHLLAAVLQLSHSKNTKVEAAKTIQRELVWTPWNSL